MIKRKELILCSVFIPRIATAFSSNFALGNDKKHGDYLQKD